VRGCARSRVGVRGRVPRPLAPVGGAKKEGRGNLSGEEEDSGGSRAWEEEDTEKGDFSFSQILNVVDGGSFGIKCFY